MSAVRPVDDYRRGCRVLVTLVAMVAVWGGGALPGFHLQQPSRPVDPDGCECQVCLRVLAHTIEFAQNQSPCRATMAIGQSPCDQPAGLPGDGHGVWWHVTGRAGVVADIAPGRRAMRPAAVHLSSAFLCIDPPPPRALA